MIAFLSIETKYVALILVSKKAIWLQLLLTKLGLLLLSDQYTEIKVIEGSKGAKEIKANLKGQKEEDNRGIASKTTLIYLFTSPKAILLKDDNQRSIVLTYNPVYHTWTKNIDIQRHYIIDKVATRWIKLQYISTNEMIADGLTKALTYAKFHTFV